MQTILVMKRYVLVFFFQLSYNAKYKVTPTPIDVQGGGGKGVLTSLKPETPNRIPLKIKA